MTTSRTSKELLDASDNARRTSDEVNAIVNKQQTLRSQVEGTTAEIRNQASMVRDHNSDSSREMQEIINLSSSTEEYTSKSLSKQQDLRSRRRDS